LNKASKIWLNYALGAAFSALLIWLIYLQLRSHASLTDFKSVWRNADRRFLLLCLVLMPVNLALESLKWRLLVNSATVVSYAKAFKSVLAGISLSVITPNRIGEYPGRLMYLREKNTFRLVSVSVLGVVAQMLTMFLFGLGGLIFYNIRFGGWLTAIILVACFVLTVAIAALYWKFEKWAPFIERIKWLRRFHVYGQLLKRFSTKQQLTILGISLLRFSIYTAQYLVLLKWMNINLPAIDGFFMSALFFWSIAVIPNIALAELPQRGQIAMFIFGNYSENLVGILSATAGVWMINLILPALIGSLFWLKIRFFK
jgi:hypothetical protein